MKKEMDVCYTVEMKYNELISKDRVCPFDTEGDETIIENESAYMTYALAPYHDDHLLVIPRRHIEHILDVQEKEQRDIDALLKQGWVALKKMGYESVSILVRDGKESGKSVGHLHYHIIPNIRIGDLDHDGNKREILTEQEKIETLARVRAVL